MKTDVIINRDALCALRELPDESVHCCVTSPPYYALRDYGLDAQIGREDTPEQYIDRLVAVFHELKRVLRPDGTFWLNIADTYCGTGSKGGYTDPKNPKGRNGQSFSLNRRAPNCKQKDLIGIPWLLAFALRADGWYLRSDIIWQKENPMPESCKDRPSRCYEHIFLLAKSKQYFYDAAAIAEPIAPTTAARYRQGRAAGHKYAEEVPGQGKVQGINKARKGGYYDDALIPTMRNKRDIWLINTVPYKGGHFAAFPPKLAETCILAGCPKGGVVIDPFFGSGTTGKAAKDLDAIGHNPHELASYLTALLQSYTPQSAQAEIERIFDMQYTLTLTEEVEVRYRTETRTDSEGNSYTVEVPYNYYILNVKLETRPITSLAPELLNDEQLEMFRVYMETSGNKPLIFGGGSPDGSPSEDISGVQFVNGTRPGNTALVDLAKQQVGNVGGYPYWSWYGFNSRVEWCACFVSWCYNQAGASEPRFSGCQSQGVPWFQSRGQWGARDYENIAPGDAIFFDWDLDGSADHVGIVIGTDGSRVYTVEGNSGDACKIKSYALTYECIKGYGLMNWD